MNKRSILEQNKNDSFWNVTGTIIFENFNETKTNNLPIGRHKA